MLGRKDVARNILILGASYGSLLGTKLLMAGHNVTLVCRRKTADLINREGTEVRIKLRDEKEHRAIHSRDLPGKVDAMPPEEVDVSRYDLVGLAMQEPQYRSPGVRELLDAVGKSKPASFKGGQYIKSVALSSSMSPGVRIASAEFSKF